MENKKPALLMYWHELGDCIMLTPHLRHLYNEGYIVDLMCTIEVEKSHLFDDCPYINKLIPIGSPHKYLNFKQGCETSIALFNALDRSTMYYWSGYATHILIRDGEHKIDANSRELMIDLQDKNLEVFIPDWLNEQEIRVLNDFQGRKEKYAFIHDETPDHPYHSWPSAQKWFKKEFGKIPVIKSGDFVPNINIMFIIAREANHRVLSSSVFVHACDAMGCTIDAINYGHADRKVWPLDQDRVLHIREEGKWIK